MHPGHVVVHSSYGVKSQKVRPSFFGRHPFWWQSFFGFGIASSDLLSFPFFFFLSIPSRMDGKPRLLLRSLITAHPVTCTAPSPSRQGRQSAFCQIYSNHASANYSAWTRWWVCNLAICSVTSSCNLGLVLLDLMGQYTHCIEYSRCKQGKVQGAYHLYAWWGFLGHCLGQWEYDSNLRNIWLAVTGGVRTFYSDGCSPNSARVKTDIEHQLNCLAHNKENVIIVLLVHVGLLCIKKTSSWLVVCWGRIATCLKRSNSEWRCYVKQ